MQKLIIFDLVIILVGSFQRKKKSYSHQRYQRQLKQKYLILENQIRKGKNQYPEFLKGSSLTIIGTKSFVIEFKESNIKNGDMIPPLHIWQILKINKLDNLFVIILIERNYGAIKIRYFISLLFKSTCEKIYTVQPILLQIEIKNAIFIPQLFFSLGLFYKTPIFLRILKAYKTQIMKFFQNQISEFI